MNEKHFSQYYCQERQETQIPALLDTQTHKNRLDFTLIFLHLIDLTFLHKSGKLINHSLFYKSFQRTCKMKSRKSF